MSQTLVEKAGEHIAQSVREASRVTAQSVREASRVTAAVADALADGVDVAKRAAKQGGDAAEDFVNDSTRRIQRNPLVTVAATAVVGFAVGMLAGMNIRKK